MFLCATVTRGTELLHSQRAKGSGPLPLLRLIRYQAVRSAEEIHY